MRQNNIFLILLKVFFFSSILVATSAVRAELKVVTTIKPLHSLIANVMDGVGEPALIIEGSTSPHSFTLKPSHAKLLEEADIIFWVGESIETFMERPLESIVKNAEVVEFMEVESINKLKFREESIFDDHDDHGQEEHRHEPEADHQAHAGETEHDDHQGHDAHADGHEQDPHVWTSPLLAQHMAGRIRDKLSELAPDHARDFARNHDAFVAELVALDAELHKSLDPLPNRKFMVFHPAWGYFAAHYGLTQVSIEREGKEPGARGLAALIGQARQEKIKVVFVQPQFDKRQAHQVARAIGGGVVSVDPLAADYVDNLRRVGRQFVQALSP